MKRTLRMTEKYKCVECAKCCKLTVYPTLDDLVKWKNKKKWNILANLQWQTIKERKFNPLLIIKQKDDKECIFLEGHECSIYEDRPESCRNFPFNNLEFSCPGRIGIDNNDRILASRFAIRRKAHNKAISKSERFITEFLIHARKIHNKNVGKGFGEMYSDRWKK